MKLDDRLMRLAARDPADEFEPPSENEIDTALARIVAQAAPAERAARRWRRWRRRGSLAVVAVASATGVALLFGVVLPAGVPAGAQNAWAKRVIARATVAALSGGNSPLYIKITSHYHQGGDAKRPNQTQVEAIWEQGTNAAMTAWNLTPKAHEISQLVQTWDSATIYDVETDTLQDVLGVKPGSQTPYDPVFQELYSIGAIPWYKPTVVGPAGVRQAMAALLRQPRVVITHAVLRGKPVIRVWHGHWRGSVYLDPKTYAPYEIFLGTKFGKNTMTYIYDAYRTIAPSQLPKNVFNLQAQHPGS
jgi:hypothetical protein